MRVSVVILACLAAVPLLAQDLPPKEWEIVKLVDGVYGFVWTDPLAEPVEGNAMFIINDDDVIVVDTGLFPSTGRLMAGELRKLTDKPVRYVVNTHWHDDHHGGNGIYRELWPAAGIISHSRTRLDELKLTYEPRPGILEGYAEQIVTIRRWIQQGHDDQGKPFDDARRKRAEGIILLLQRAIDELGEIEPALPDLVIESDLVLHRGPRTIEIRYLGFGNTRGDLIVHLPEEGIVATGDLLVYPVPFGIGSNYREWIDTLDAVLELGAEVLFPGHGPPMKDDQYLMQVRGLLSDLVARVDAAVADGLSLEETQARVTLADWKEKLAKGDPASERAFDAYFVAPAVKRAWELAKGVAPESERL